MPLLLRGMAGKDSVMSLAQSALARFSSVDIVKLSVDDAGSLNEACDIWKAILSYGDVSKGVEWKATMLCGWMVGGWGRWTRLGRGPRERGWRLAL